MLKCENIKCQISAYLDREIPLWKIRLIQWHFRRCPSCSHEFVRFKQADKIIRRLDLLKTSENFLAELMCQAECLELSQKRQTSFLRRLYCKFESSVAWRRYIVIQRASAHGFLAALALFMVIGTFVIVCYLRDAYLRSDVTPLIAQSVVEESELVWIDIISSDLPKRHLSVNE